MKKKVFSLFLVSVAIAMLVWLALDIRHDTLGTPLSPREILERAEALGISFFFLLLATVMFEKMAEKNVDADPEGIKSASFKEYGTVLALSAAIFDIAYLLINILVNRRWSSPLSWITVNMMALMIGPLYYTLLKGRVFNKRLKDTALLASRLQEELDSQKVPVENDYVILKSEEKMKKIFFDDIIYIKSMENYVIINTVTSKEVVSITLKKILTMLPAQKFAQVHRCYIVNLSKITAFTSTELTIADALIPIGRSYKHNLDKRQQDERLSGLSESSLSARAKMSVQR